MQVLHNCMQVLHLSHTALTPTILRPALATSAGLFITLHLLCPGMALSYLRP
jgi:hypothetical protein